MKKIKDIIAKGRPSASVAHLPEYRYIWGVHDGYEYALEEFKQNRIARSTKVSGEALTREMTFIYDFIKEHRCMPTYSDAIEATRKQIINKALEWIKTNIRPYYSEVKYHYDDFVKTMED